MGLVRIRYTGLSDERIISQQDLNKSDTGIKLPKGTATLHWHKGNRWAVDMEPTENLLQLLEKDGFFRVEELDDDQEPVNKPIVMDSGEQNEPVSHAFDPGDGSVVQKD